MVFDVESVGLHGEGFAVGWVVVDNDGVELDAGLYACPYWMAMGGLPDDREWVKRNIPQLPQTHERPYLMRESFWRHWCHWKEKGYRLAADVAWPVEARFLSQCIEQMLPERNWFGPYPLIDIASVRLAVGYDPVASYQRKENELPEHNPLSDARQSARLLIEAWNKVVPS